MRQVSDVNDGAAFVRVLVIGRSSVQRFGREFPRVLEKYGIDGVKIETRAGTFSNGYLTHVTFSGILLPSQWERVADWCQVAFPRLNADYVIRQQLSILGRYGVTGEEGHERDIA